MARGVSTVVDVSLAVLLITASVVTLVATGQPPTGDDGDARKAASLIAATTVELDYPDGTASGTLAGLLADAALPDTPDGFDAAVRRRTRETLQNVSTPVQVTAAPLGGERRTTVGGRPPPSATVATTTFVVPAARNRTPVRIVVRTWSE